MTITTPFIGSEALDESQLVAGLPVTTPERTAFDLGRRTPVGWEEVMLAVEYDGEHHRLDRWQYKKDIRRSEDLDRLGWIVIRVTAGDHPADIARRVRAALEARRSSLR